MSSSLIQDVWSAWKVTVFWLFLLSNLMFVLQQIGTRLWRGHPWAAPYLSSVDDCNIKGIPNSPVYLIAARLVANCVAFFLPMISITICWLAVFPLDWALTFAFQCFLPMPVYPPSPWHLFATIVSAYAVWQLMQTDTNEESDVEPTGPSHRVAVIGAGPAGLCTAKELLEQGHQPIIFDKADAIGGLWHRGCARRRTAVVLPSTYSSSSAYNTGFSDFPIQAEFGGPETYCISQKGFRAYLHGYAEHFKLLEKAEVMLNTQVISMEQEKSGKWVLSVQDVRQPDASPERFQFDNIAVCSGQASQPFIPKLPGQEHFTGIIRHASTLQDESDFEVYNGRRVLCVGGGESASDMALEVSSRASKCDISLRNPCLVLLRNLWGAHPDFIENRTLFMGPHWLRWLIYKLSILVVFPFNNAFARSWKGQTLWVPSFRYQWKMMFTPKYLAESLAGLRSMCSSVQTTKTENYLYVLEMPGNKYKPGIVNINEEGLVLFEDDSVQQYDEILLCSGYSPGSFSFLPKEYQGQCCANDRYLSMFHPQMPGIAFIGFARGIVGSLTLGFEMQARLFALVVSGKRSLPSTEDMEVEIRRSKTDKQCYNYTRATWVYANYLARNHIGCEPNGWKFFVWHPVEFIKGYCGAPSGFIYRMHGPGAKPKIALEGLGLTSCGIYDMPPAWFLQHPFWVATGLACELFWSKLPFIGHLFEPLLNWYY